MNAKLVELAQDILDMEMEWQLALEKSVAADTAREKAIEAAEAAAEALAEAADHSESARLAMKRFLMNSEK